MAHGWVDTRVDRGAHLTIVATCARRSVEAAEQEAADDGAPVLAAVRGLWSGDAHVQPPRRANCVGGRPVVCGNGALAVAAAWLCRLLRPPAHRLLHGTHTGVSCLCLAQAAAEFELEAATQPVATFKTLLGSLPPPTLANRSGRKGDYDYELAHTLKTAFPDSFPTSPVGKPRRPLPDSHPLSGRPKAEVGGDEPATTAARVPQPPSTDRGGPPNQRPKPTVVVSRTAKPKQGSANTMTTALFPKVCLMRHIPLLCSWMRLLCCAVLCCAVLA